MSNAVVTCILSVCSLNAHVLFHLNSTHSYVSLMFSKCFTKDLVRLEKSFLMAIPMGETMLVKVGYRVCSVLVRKLDIVADLMVLDIIDFDIILGMDWLASCHAT